MEKKVNEAPKKEEQKEKKDHKLLIIIIILLLLLSVGAYFVVRHFVKVEDPDITIVKLMNESYQVYEKANGKVSNEHDAHSVMTSRGYIIEDLLLSKDTRVVVWDSVNDCFALLEGGEMFYTPADKSGTGEELWTFVRDVPTSSKYSVFWCGTVKVTEPIVIGKDKKGVDIVEDQEIVYSDHSYAKSVSQGTITYTCAECGKSYSVKRK